jgi:hypothetical protein
MVATVREETPERRAIGSHVWPGFIPVPNNISVNPNNILEWIALFEITNNRTQTAPVLLAGMTWEGPSW